MFVASDFISREQHIDFADLATFSDTEAVERDFPSLPAIKQRQSSTDQDA
jgi:hypothetical protein